MQLNPSLPDRYFLYTEAKDSRLDYLGVAHTRHR